MAWLDDRIWCHPKFADVPDRAFRVWVNAITYSTGFNCKGVLTAGQQRMIGSDARTRRQLVDAGLWDDLDDAAVRIHDWDDHNSKRDARREADRERKRAQRAGQTTGTSAGQSAGHTAGRSAENRDARRALTEVKEVTEVKRPPVPAGIETARTLVHAVTDAVAYDDHTKNGTHPAELANVLKEMPQ